MQEDEDLKACIKYINDWLVDEIANIVLYQPATEEKLKECNECLIKILALHNAEDIITLNVFLDTERNSIRVSSEIDEEKAKFFAGYLRMIRQ